MQFSLKCDEEILALTHYEKEIMILYDMLRNNSKIQHGSH